MILVSWINPPKVFDIIILSKNNKKSRVFQF